MTTPLEEPRLLVLETSGRVGQVGVARGQELLAVRRLDEARRHARDLAPAVADLLAGQAWKPGEVQAVIVSRGPGSYTGLRVGIASAKVFAYATGSAFLAVDTFAAIAAQAPEGVARLDVLADAQQGQIYVQSFVRADDWQTVTPLAIRAFGEWLAQRDPASGVTGPGVPVYAEHLPTHVPRLPPETWHPNVASVLRLGLARYRAGERDDAWAAEPLYLRPSSAEQQHAKRPPA
jgi:tRNA threonylcarbamoyladenosine biosynthesis protein TsaB